MDVQEISNCSEAWTELWIRCEHLELAQPTSAIDTGINESIENWIHGFVSTRQTSWQQKVSQCRKARFRTVQNSSANLDGSPVQAFSLSSLTFATYNLANNRKLYEKSFVGSSCTAKKVWKRLTLKREKNWTLRHCGSRTVRALICWSTCSLRSATGHINQIIFLSNRGHSTFHYMLRKHDKDRRRVSQKQKD